MTDPSRPRLGTGRAAPARLRAQLDRLAAAPATVTPPRLITRPAPPPLTIAEAPFQRLVTDAAEIFGWLWYHSADSRRDNPGFPDLTMVRVVPPYALILAELKTERGRLRAEQCMWATALLRAGVRYYLWRPSNWSEILAVLQGDFPHEEGKLEGEGVSSE